MSLQKKVWLSFLSIVFGMTMTACGNNSNNDQGTAFLALGYFEFVDPTSPDDVVPVTGLTFDLESDFEFGNGTAAGVGTGSFQTVLIGLENRLATQFIRSERYDCSYDVPGAQPGLLIPDSVERASFVIGAAEGITTTAEGDTRFPSDNDAVRPQVLFSRISVLNTETVQFLNTNRNSLPQLPYSLTATCRAVGITQAGDVITTNPVSIPVLLTRSSFFNAPAGAPIVSPGTDTEQLLVPPVEESESESTL